ncbi:MAG: ORF6N domain-containing protein [Planctomycetes bacterium]|nr:ORF6N domain-containing protein [Planctomycetota bacterium]
MKADRSLIPSERIEKRILLIRGQKVILDSALAALYGVETRALVQAVKRNLERFPVEFMLRLTSAETRRLRSQSVMSNGRGGRRTPPLAFTEAGVAMLSSVLKSRRAISVNIEIVKTFVRLRHYLMNYADLERGLRALQKKCNANFGMVFDALRQLMNPPDPPREKIGFIARRTA